MIVCKRNHLDIVYVIFKNHVIKLFTMIPNDRLLDIHNHIIYYYTYITIIVTNLELHDRSSLQKNEEK